MYYVFVFVANCLNLRRFQGPKVGTSCTFQPEQERVQAGLKQGRRGANAGPPRTSVGGPRELPRTSEGGHTGLPRTGEGGNA